MKTKVHAKQQLESVFQMRHIGFGEMCIYMLIVYSALSRHITRTRVVTF